MSEIILLSDEMEDILPMQGRSEGVHVSSVIHDLCKRLGYFEGDLPLNQAWFELGNAMEWAMSDRLEKQYPGRYIQPGELELDGLFGTPDLLDIEDWADEEIKLAWMSAKHEPDSQKFWRYWAQVMAYCKMLGTNLGRLRVCFINGDYSAPGPVYRFWEQEFSDEELDENWAMLITAGQRLEEEGA